MTTFCSCPRCASPVTADLLDEFLRQQGKPALLPWQRRLTERFLDFLATSSEPTP